MNEWAVGGEGKEEGVGHSADHTYSKGFCFHLKHCGILRAEKAIPVMWDDNRLSQKR